MDKKSYNIIIKPIITEKAVTLVKSFNTYTFKVTSRATKVEIKKAVKDRFDVSVVNVKILNMPIKKVRWGAKRLIGKKSGYKKAYVTLVKGDKIPAFEVK